MTSLDQLPFNVMEYAMSPVKRCPCLLLLDTSMSMRGRPIDQLNEGLQTFKSQLMDDKMAMQSVELGIITFGPVKIEAEFQTADQFSPPTLIADGDTPMGSAIERGLDMLAARKAVYRQAGIGYFRPWVFLITDGAPTDSWQTAAERIHDGDHDQKKTFSFFAVGVDGADMTTLSRICSPDRPPLPLKGLNFQKMFCWLSGSLKGVSRSQPGQRVPLAAPSGWADVG